MFFGCLDFWLATTCCSFFSHYYYLLQCAEVLSFGKFVPTIEGVSQQPKFILQNNLHRACKVYSSLEFDSNCDLVRLKTTIKYHKRRGTLDSVISRVEVHNEIDNDYR